MPTTNDLDEVVLIGYGSTKKSDLTGAVAEERINLFNPQVFDHGAFDANIHLLRPIPQFELQLSEGTLIQNPGY